MAAAAVENLFKVVVRSRYKMCLCNSLFLLKLFYLDVVAQIYPIRQKMFANFASYLVKSKIPVKLNPSDVLIGVISSITIKFGINFREMTTHGNLYLPSVPREDDSQYSTPCL